MTRPDFWVAWQDRNTQLHDGTPDTWEMDKELNPVDGTDGALDRDGDGYTNLEEYLNFLAP